MSLEVESKVQETCTFCYKVLSGPDITIIDDDTFILLQLLAKNMVINTLKNALVCTSCLENINAACQFKTSLENLLMITNVKEGGTADQTFVTCSTCNNSIKQTSAIPLLDGSYIEDVLNTLILKQGLEVLDNPQICESCQISAFNFHQILAILGNCENKATDNFVNAKNIIDIGHEIKKETNNQIESPIKEEVKEEEQVCDQEFKIKQEELDLKIDFDEEHSREGVWKDDSRNLTSLNKTLICKICQYQVKHKRQFNRHMMVHKNNNEFEMFKCKICKFKTKYKESFKKHLIIHEDVKTETLESDQCKYQTKHKDCLKNHKITHKNRTKIFKCNQCQYETKYKHVLKAHFLTHKGVDETEVFKCQQCDFRTKYKIYLKQHMLIHKDSSETEIFRCNQCKFKTKRKYYIKKHMLIHKDFSETDMFRCEQCAFQTKHKLSLKHHMLVHKNVSKTTIF